MSNIDKGSSFPFKSEEDFMTPPESPKISSSSSSCSSESLNLSSHESNERFPIAPPRHRRGKDRLQESNQSTQQNVLQGHLSVLVISAKGFRQFMKSRWFVYHSPTGRLKYYRNEREGDVLGDIDILSATFCYDIQSDTKGEFLICTKNGDHVLSAGSPEKRMYWLQHLQRFRHEHSQYNSMIVNQVGLLKNKTPPRLPPPPLPPPPSSSYINKENISFKDMRLGCERPENENRVCSPKSADAVKKTANFFQNLTKNKGNFKIPRSSSLRTPSPPPSHFDTSSPFKTSSSSSFQTLNKIRKSFRDKKNYNSLWYSKGESPNEFEKEMQSLKETLQATQDEASASKEAIFVFQKQIQTLQKEKETLSELRNPELNEGQLLDILRDKDRLIIDLETLNKELRNKILNLEDDLRKEKESNDTYQHLLEVKDDKLIKLTTQLQNLEEQTLEKDEIPSSSRRRRITSVEIGIQVNDLDEEREKLQDTVLAYVMQNKFLNKEVLELNILKQKAKDQEQKWFIEASDWEAKFYQIQSKYLLLLNELHNPQVGISASRQEMVSQLLKDIVEAAEKPTLVTVSKSYDRFGFRMDGGEDSLEDKAQMFRKIAENISESDVNETPERRWEDLVSVLNGKSLFIITHDIKRLLRLGIPISHRGEVWKAVVDDKLLRNSNENSRFPTDYYKKLLSNYNPSRNLTAAAKQIELDLLRTLPNNKHYESIHAPGIPKLRRVLLAYSTHNPDVEYCQGFNRIAAIALLFMNEEDAFWCLVYIIEHLMPVDCYSRDKQLIGAQVEQEVLKELIVEKLPSLSAHFSLHGIDPSIFTLNWFLCIFVDTLPVKTYLTIWDSFLFEGSKVLFRYALAIFKILEDTLMVQSDYMSIVNSLREGVETLTDIDNLTRIAFVTLNPFPLKNISVKREHHYKVLEAHKLELDKIRQNFRKNSLARCHQSSSIVTLENPEA